jgi:hypothetical protein
MYCCSVPGWNLVLNIEGIDDQGAETRKPQEGREKYTSFKIRTLCQILLGQYNQIGYDGRGM